MLMRRSARCFLAPACPSGWDAKITRRDRCIEAAYRAGRAHRKQGPPTRRDGPGRGTSDVLGPTAYRPRGGRHRRPTRRCAAMGGVPMSSAPFLRHRRRTGECIPGIEGPARRRATRGRFGAEMVYEFRTPLQAVGGYVDLMAMGIHRPVTEQQRQVLERIHAGMVHVVRLTTTVLDRTATSRSRARWAPGPSSR